jgi:hypothetical protein
VTRLPTVRTWALMCAAAALVGWWSAPVDAPEPAIVKPRRDDWLLPDLPRRAVENAAVVAAAAAPFWGSAALAPATAASAPPEDPRWRIAAVFGDASRRGVLVVFEQEGRPAARLYAGDKLPSGHVITSVREREVCVQVGNKSYRLGVERREP